MEMYSILFNFRLALANTELIRTYTSIDVRVPVLLYTIRSWAKYNNLIGRTALQITSYALTVMVINYLQQLTPPVLPCLQKCHNVNKIIGLWNCGFCTHDQVVNNTLNLGKG